MPAKTHVFIVKPTGQSMSATRLIRGTRYQVEAKLRAEVSIEPCTAEQAHDLADVAIESIEDGE